MSMEKKVLVSNKITVSARNRSINGVPTADRLITAKGANLYTMCSTGTHISTATLTSH